MIDAHLKFNPNRLILPYFILTSRNTVPLLYLTVLSPLQCFDTLFLFTRSGCVVFSRWWLGRT